jgi:mono/diheme cytochrome c family protein
MNRRISILLAYAMGVLCHGVDAAELAPAVRGFLDRHCAECHDSDLHKGGLDLTALTFDLENPKSFAQWVKVHDRVRDGEMPPKKKPRPDPDEMSSFLEGLGAPMRAADEARATREGRSTWRRLNRYEYENTVRELLQAPWLEIRDMLPEDGESHRFNKLGEALDVSHVQMGRYLAAADYALRQVMAKQVERPPTTTTRYYTRDQRSFTGPMKFSVFNTRPERATFAVLGTKGQPDVRAGKAPVTVGATNAELRELEGVGVVASAYEPIEPKFNRFDARLPGHYKIRLHALSVWVGPGKPDKWWIPDLDEVSPGRRAEPVTVYAERRPRILRRLGAFDVAPEPSVHELDVWLVAGETIRPDAARLFRSRPPNWHNPLAQRDGQPGVVFRWLEVEGPIYEEWPTAGHRLLFGDLPLKPIKGGGVEVVSAHPKDDSRLLLRGFLQRAYRRPVEEAEVRRFLPVIQRAMKSGSSFAEAMLAGYSAVLCSPGFVCLEERPGLLDDYALASRLAYFLWNSPPDAELRELAARRVLHEPKTLRAQTERLLEDGRSRRFVDAFLDYWLDLRRMDATAPDAGLYPDYYLDDLLTESAAAETQLFFAELLRHDLAARTLVASDFAMLNERLAQHYGLWREEQPAETGSNAPVNVVARPALVEGVALRRVPLPAGNPRGGLLTQASILKVTANGTTTSPVLRGAWVMERILGRPPPPPPATVPAVEPDTRGATTIREQLEKHRNQETCAACHAKMDPAGFALETFDVLGGWRDRYRAVGEGAHEKGYGKNGQPFEFHLAQPVDPSGVMLDGRPFSGIREFKQLLLADEKLVARNLAQQLTVYGTGAPIRFGDRPEIEAILERASSSHFGVKSLVTEIVQSQLFRRK